MARIFRTLKEVKEFYLPNKTVEVLDGEITAQEARRQLNRFLEIRGRRQAEVVEKALTSRSNK